MGLQHLALDEITEADLQRLIDDREEERRSVEYKATLPGAKDSEKKEFLADVASLANAVGGDLVYGIEEVAGVAHRICGLPGINPDGEILRLEQCIREGIAPRIPGIESRVVPVSSVGSVLIVRVPGSWATPHMVTFQGSSRFFTRSSKGKYRMDVFEIRAAFVAAEELIERVRKLRSERLTAISADETPVLLKQLGHGARMVMHLMPFSAVRPGSFLSFGRNTDQLKMTLRPMIPSVGSWSTRVNFDGLLAVASDVERQPFAYAQLFRSGTIEAVDRLFLNISSHPRSLFGDDIAKLLITHAKGYLSILEMLGAQPPVVIAVTFLGVRGYQLAGSFSPDMLVAPSVGIDRDNLLVPDVLLQSFKEPVEVALQPVLDAIWNACGFESVPTFDATGNRRSRK